MKDGASACRLLLLALPNVQQGQLRWSQSWWSRTACFWSVLPDSQQGSSGLQSGSPEDRSLLCLLALLPLLVPCCIKLCMLKLNNFTYIFAS